MYYIYNKKFASIESHGMSLINS